MTHPHILQVEDEPGDVLGPRRAIDKARPGCVFHWVRNGDQAIDYLSGPRACLERSKYPFPSIVLLDLSLPGIDGFDLLAWVAAHPQWRSLPFLVLTGSLSAESQQRALKLGAKACFEKGDDYSLLGEYVAQLLPLQNKPAEGIVQAALIHRRLRHLPTRLSGS